MLSVADLFKGSHFDREIIILCVRWYLRFKLSTSRAGRPRGFCSKPDARVRFSECQNSFPSVHCPPSGMSPPPTPFSGGQPGPTAAQDRA
jgi:hypothetical protein